MRVLLLLLAAGCAACSYEPLQPLPLEVSLAVQPAAAAVGDSVRFEINAQGSRLLGLVLEYGDGRSESLPAYGARTARAIYRHAYSRSGVYVVTATATDVTEGDKQASTRVEIR